MCIKPNSVLWIILANEIPLQMPTSHLQCSSPVLFDRWGSPCIVNNNIEQLFTFVEVNMFVCRPENPILTEAVAEVNIMDIQVCKQTYLPKTKVYYCFII